MDRVSEEILRVMIKQDRDIWDVLSATPDKFFLNIQRTLYTINSKIKDIADVKKLSKFDEICFRSYVEIIGNKDFQRLIADIIIKESKKDSDKTLLNIVDIVKLISQILSLYEENKRMILFDYGKVLKPLRDTYVCLYMLFTAAEIDLFQKVKSKDCPFNNLLNWLGNPKAWEVQLARAYKYGNT